MVKPNKPSPNPATPADDFNDLIERARRGDRSTLPELRRVLCDPYEVDVLGGDLALQAEASFVQAMAGDDLAVAQVRQQRLQRRRCASASRCDVVE